MMIFPNTHLDLLKDESKAYLFLTTIMPDGSPQITPVWFNTEGENILINTSEGRVKEKNMKARPKVAAVIQDPADPFRYVQVRGEVIAHTREAADEHINTLSLKYTGQPWDAQSNQKRIIFKIKPLHFDAH
jgi:PPOX class probable F420-dependent enzyme